MQNAVEKLNAWRTTALNVVPEWMVNDMRIDEAIKFAEYAQTMTDIPEVKEFYAMAEKALRTQNQVNWMSVKDRLPNPKTEVLVWERNPNSHEYSREIRFYDPMMYMPGWEYVTHWMPMPEPPERDDE